MAATRPVPVDPDAAGPAASAVVAAWVRHDVDPGEWAAGLVPLLSASAADAVQGTEPAEVVATEVTGEPVRRETGSELLALLDVPTDAGSCSVLLSWDDLTGRWQGERVACSEGSP